MNTPRKRFRTVTEKESNEIYVMLNNATTSEDVERLIGYSEKVCEANREEAIRATIFGSLQCERLAVADWLLKRYPDNRDLDDLRVLYQLSEGDWWEIKTLPPPEVHT